MACPETAKLWDAPKDAEHLADCGECRARQEDIHFARSALLAVPALPEERWARIDERVLRAVANEGAQIAASSEAGSEALASQEEGTRRAHAPRASSGTRHRASVRAWAAAAAAGVLMLASAAWWLRSSNGSSAQRLTKESSHAQPRIEVEKRAATEERGEPAGAEKHAVTEVRDDREASEKHAVAEVHLEREASEKRAVAEVHLERDAEAKRALAKVRAERVPKNPAAEEIDASEEALSRRLSAQVALELKRGGHARVLSRSPERVVLSLDAGSARAGVTGANLGSARLELGAGEVTVFVSSARVLVERVDGNVEVFVEEGSVEVTHRGERVTLAEGARWRSDAPPVDPLPSPPLVDAQSESGRVVAPEDPSLLLKLKTLVDQGACDLVVPQIDRLLRLPTVEVGPIRPMSEGLRRSLLDLRARCVHP